MRTALTIAASDSGGGAGIQADLKTFAAFGVYGTSAITAVTAQNTLGIDAVVALPADVITAQIEAVATDIVPHATKIGALATAAIVEAVAAAIEELDLPLVVIDPVFASSRGERLLDDDGLEALRSELLPLARVVTPNIPEAEALTGHRIRCDADVREAARRIQNMGPRAVVITGGHADWGGSGAPADVTDLLLDDRFHEFRTARVESPAAHGTGCTFASAVAAGLALGVALSDATRDAQQYVAGAIRHASPVGGGRVALHHFWRGVRL